MQGYGLVQSSGHAQGKVIELVEVQTYGNARAWAPKVTFVAPDGTLRQFVSRAFAVPADYTVGQKVDVRYALSAAGDAEIEDLKNLWGKTFGLALLGVVLCGIGGFTYWLEQAGPDALKSIDTGKLIGTVFLLVGPLVLIVAAFQTAATLTFISSSRVSPGTVERLETVYSHGGAFVIHPVLVFELDGRKIHFISTMGSYPAGYQAGEKVQIRYAPDFPERARIDSWLETWNSTVVMGGAGLILTLLGWLLRRFLVSPA